MGWIEVEDKADSGVAPVKTKAGFKNIRPFVGMLHSNKHRGKETRYAQQGDNRYHAEKQVNVTMCFDAMAE